MHQLSSSSVGVVEAIGLLLILEYVGVLDKKLTLHFLGEQLHLCVSMLRVALLQDIARGVPLTEAFERRLLTPYSTFVGSLDPAR